MFRDYVSADTFNFFVAIADCWRCLRDEKLVADVEIRYEVEFRRMRKRGGFAERNALRGQGVHRKCDRKRGGLQGRIQSAI